MKKWIYCPDCNLQLGRYNKALEESRVEQGFKTWCSNCDNGVTPIYK